MYCINRTLIKQRLLVKFSCEFPYYILLRDLLVSEIIGCYVWWLPQQQNSMTSEDFVLRKLLISYSYSSSTVSLVLNIKKKPARPQVLRDILARQAKPSQSSAYLSTCVVWLHYPVWMQQIVIFVQKACAAGSPCDLFMQSSGVVH